LIQTRKEKDLTRTHCCIEDFCCVEKALHIIKIEYWC